MQRSLKEFQTAVELVRNGRIGKLKQVWVALPYYSTKGGPFATPPVPPQLNWDMYQGQAPLHDYCVERTIGNFRWWSEYAGGIITDWGNHHMDIAHWGMDCDLTGPTSVEARALYPQSRRPAVLQYARSLLLADVVSQRR
jgi:predicted dehydrogenase